jgi:hypothetical protein
MNLVLPQINFIEVPRLMSVTYTATLPVRDQTVLYLSSLLHAERVRRGTRKDRRVLTCFKQAILVLRWFLDGTRVTQLAVDNAIGKSTVYAYLDEGFTVLAAQAPGLESALLAAKWPDTVTSPSTAQQRYGPGHLDVARRKLPLRELMGRRNPADQLVRDGSAPAPAGPGSKPAHHCSECSKTR